MTVSITVHHPMVQDAPAVQVVPAVPAAVAAEEAALTDIF